MTEQLIQTVEEEAREEIREIREQAVTQASRIKEEAVAEGKKLKRHHLEYWKNVAALERTSIIAAQEKTKLELLQTKEEIFEEVFHRAREELASLRDDPRYEEFQRFAITEALSELEGYSATLHVDERDEALCRKILNILNVNHDVISDIETMGGVIASTPDDSIVVKNTLESRLQKSKEVLRKEIFSILDGG